MITKQLIAIIVVFYVVVAAGNFTAGLVVGLDHACAIEAKAVGK